MFRFFFILFCFFGDFLSPPFHCSTQLNLHFGQYLFRWRVFLLLLLFSLYEVPDTLYNVRNAGVHHALRLFIQSIVCRNLIHPYLQLPVWRCLISRWWTASCVNYLRNYSPSWRLVVCKYDDKPNRRDSSLKRGKSAGNTREASVSAFNVVVVETSDR